MLDTQHLTRPLSDPVAVFAVVMLVLTAAPLLATRARIPGLIGIILAGAIIGPNSLNILVRDNTIELLGTVGLLYLLFAAALDMDLRQLVKLRFRSLTFAMMSFGIPMLLAVTCGTRFLGLSTQAALLMGSIIGTHTLLAYPIVQHLGLTKNKAIIMTVGGSVATDAMGLLVLAVVMRSIAGNVGALFWIGFLSLIVLYLIIVIRGVPALGRWFFRSFPNQPTGELAFLLAVLFAVAVGAQLIGLAPIIGAFLAGLALNRLIPPSSPLMSRLKFIGNALFIPFFLLSVGMLLDFRVLVGSLTVWWMALWFIGLLAVGKFLAAMITQRIFGHSVSEGWMIFGLSFPQAAATLAVTLIAYEPPLQLFSLEMVNAVILMILVSCIIGPSMLERFGRVVAQDEEKAAPVLEDSPQRLLVPLANPATAVYLMDIALAIRDEDYHQPVFPLAVAPDTDNVEAEVARSEKLLIHAVAQGVDAGVQVTPVTRVDMNIADGIVRAIKEMRISTVVIGWTGQLSTRERVFGTVLDQLLERTQEQTLVCRLDHPLNTTNRVILLVPPLARMLGGFDEAIHTMKTLAKQLGAKLVVLSVEGADPKLRKSIESIRPELSLTFVQMENWNDLLSSMATQIESDELIVLLSAREQTLAWYRGLNRLPGRIITNFPNNNFIALYPTEILRQHVSGELELEAPRPSHPLLAAVEPENIAIGTEGIGPESALGKAILNVIQKQPGADPQATNVLFQKLALSAVQLKADVVLLHAPCMCVRTPRLFLGLNSEGLQLPGTTGDVHLIYVLVSPPDLAPERHLQDLAFLVRLLPDKGSVDRLLEAKAPEDVIKILDAHAE